MRVVQGAGHAGAGTSRAGTSRTDGACSRGAFGARTTEEVIRQVSRVILCAGFVSWRPRVGVSGVRLVRLCAWCVVRGAGCVGRGRRRRCMLQNAPPAGLRRRGMRRSFFRSCGALESALLDAEACMECDVERWGADVATSVLVRSESALTDARDPSRGAAAVVDAPGECAAVGECGHAGSLNEAVLEWWAGNDKSRRR